MVANWKLCGKWPSEKPRSPSSRSASGPVTPAPSSASPDTSSSECSWFEPAQVERDHGLEVAADRIEAADHAGAPAERDDGNAVVRAVPQDRGDLVVVAGQQHRVGCVLDAGVLAAQQVEGGLAACAQQPGTVVDAAVLGADDRGQRVAVGGRQRRRSQLDLVRARVRPRSTRPPRAPASAVTECRRRVASPPRGRPMRSTSSGAGVRSVGHPDASCVTVLHMLSISNDPSPTIGDRILEAAASCVLAYGVDRVTLAEIARRARVSRPTVYRRWPDTRSILAALLTRRITGVLDEMPSRGVGREALVERDRRGRRAAAPRRRGHVGAAKPRTSRWCTSPNAWAPASRS